MKRLSFNLKCLIASLFCSAAIAQPLQSVQFINQSQQEGVSYFLTGDDGKELFFTHVNAGQTYALPSRYFDRVANKTPAISLYTNQTGRIVCGKHLITGAISIIANMDAGNVALRCVVN